MALVSGDVNDDQQKRFWRELINRKFLSQENRKENLSIAETVRDFKLTGFIVKEDGEERTITLNDEITLGPLDVAEVALGGGRLFVKLSRDREQAFNEHKPNRAERRREEKGLAKAVRLIELE